MSEACTARRFVIKPITQSPAQVDIPRMQGKEGVVIVKTNQALLVGHHPENVQTPNAANVVELLADYLIKVGY